MACPRNAGHGRTNSLPETGSSKCPLWELRLSLRNRSLWSVQNRRHKAKAPPVDHNPEGRNLGPRIGPLKRRLGGASKTTATKRRKSATMLFLQVLPRVVLKARPGYPATGCVGQGLTRHGLGSSRSALAMPSERVIGGSALRRLSEPQDGL